MKRLLALGAMVVFISNLLFAETAVLIDFNELTDDSNGNNQATIIDFGVAAGSSFSQEERDQMRTSLFIGNWVPHLNSSAITRDNNRLTLVKPVQSAHLGGATVMGVRARFPQGSNNANVTVKPPFSIPSLSSTDGADGDASIARAFRPTRFDNKGLVKNVGVIKSVSMNIRGLNFPHSVSILLADFNDKITEIPMGNVDFNGWKTLTWTNPSYIYEVRKRDLKNSPLYPISVPVVKLGGIRFSKNGMHDGGDFIAYIKDVTVTYDKAVRDDVPQDIDDEEIWEILSAREAIRLEQETRNFAERMVLDFIEMKLIDSSTDSMPIQDTGTAINSRVNTPAGGGA